MQTYRAEGPLVHAEVFVNLYALQRKLDVAVLVWTLNDLLTAALEVVWQVAVFPLKVAALNEDGRLHVRVMR